MLRWLASIWREVQRDRLRDQLWKAQEQRIKQLSIEQARAEALQVLRDESVFRLAPATTPPNPDILVQLPEDVRELASQYARIELVGTELPDREADGLNFQQIAPSELEEGFLRIGRLAADSDVSSEVAVRPGEAGVYSLYLELGEPERVPSVYHWLLQEYWLERAFRIAEEQFEGETRDRTQQ